MLNRSQQKPTTDGAMAKAMMHAGLRLSTGSWHFSEKTKEPKITKICPIGTLKLPTNVDSQIISYQVNNAKTGICLPRYPPTYSRLNWQCLMGKICHQSKNMNSCLNLKHLSFWMNEGYLFENYILISITFCSWFYGLSLIQ